MCGICGQLRPDRSDPVEGEFLRAMNHTLRHRGPDTEGYEVRAGVGLAISRLAIIDVAGIILLLWPFIWFCFKTKGM